MLARVAALAAVLALSAPVALADPAGKTTLTQTIRPAAGSGYVGLVAKPGEPYVVRGHAKRKRARTRRSLAFFAQLTDPQIADEMSPARVDFIDPAGGELKSAWRPMEALELPVFDATVRNVNANRTSPVKDGKGKRAKLGLVLTTGDLADNQQLNETRWFKAVLDGGRVDPFSGQAVSATNQCAGASADTVNALNAAVAARQYTGVQDYDDWRGAPPDRYAGFWDPEEAAPTSGPYSAFPRYPGLLERAQAPFTAQGLKVPWYIARGNHDGLVQGNAPASTDLFRAIATGCLKVFPSAAIDPKSFEGIPADQLFTTIGDPAFIQQLLAGARMVPPDPDRRILSTVEYKKIVGGSHGYSHVDQRELKASKGVAAYYAFTPRPGVEFISLDTVAEGGGANGNLDDPQYRWLERTLKQARTADRLVIAYGHHTLETLDNTRTDEQAGTCDPPDEPGCDGDPRKSTPIHLGTEGKRTVQDLFFSYPNLIAYVAGHTHANRVDEFRRGSRRFWEINTASHIDWPQQSRLIQLMDNRDGTLSLFATMLDTASPIAAPAPGGAGAFTSAQLSSLSRVMSWNDPQREGLESTSGVGSKMGRRADRNVELLLPDPRR
jgi:metallophosphoesterase (TIGR03767 family)